MSKQIVLFVHGLLGHSKQTWGSFPDLVRADPELAGSWEPATFSFPTPAFRLPCISAAPTIQTLADGLMTEIDGRYHDATSLVLVCHSLGGLVARRYVLDQFKRSGNCRAARLLLFGTPNSGAGLAKVASYISLLQPQLRQLCRHSEFLTELNRDWLDLSINEKFQTTCVIGGADDVVSEESARGFWPTENIRVVVDASHVDLVKPKDRKDLRYRMLYEFLVSPSLIGISQLMRSEAILLGYYAHALAFLRPDRSDDRVAVIAQIKKFKAIPRDWISAFQWDELTSLDDFFRAARRLADTRNPLLAFFDVGHTAGTFETAGKSCAKGQMGLDIVMERRDQLVRFLTKAQAPKSLTRRISEDNVDLLSLSQEIMPIILKWI